MVTIWTNGCFDVLHRGHFEMFKYAKSLGDELIVGIDSDKKVKKDKRIVKKKEEEEAKKLRGMASYLEDYRKEDRPPVGFTEKDIELLKTIYDPDHQIWEIINREREPMWPSIEEETAIV